MVFEPASPPASELARYRILSPRCGLRVSPLVIGGVSFGDGDWAKLMGTVSKDSVFELLDSYRAQGGNFIDLANNYHDGQSEEWVGEWMALRGCRDEMVIATKYSASFNNFGEGRKKIQANFGGDSAKSMRLSIESSLKRLRTSYVDILYVHMWTYDTPIEEVMTYLNDLVRQGKVNYLGVSDTPGWIVSKANQYARDHGLRQFVVYQGRHSPLNREMERDIFPMCQSEGMAMAHWGVLGQGSFGPNPPNSGDTDRMVRVADQEAVSRTRKVLGQIAQVKSNELNKDISMASIAVAWSINKAPYTYPIIGMRSIKTLKANIEALTVTLTEAEMNAIDDAATDGPMNRGWPENFTAPAITHGQVKGPGDLFWTGTEIHVAAQ